MKLKDASGRVWRFTDPGWQDPYLWRRCVVCRKKYRKVDDVYSTNLCCGVCAGGAQ